MNYYLPHNSLPGPTPLEEVENTRAPSQSAAAKLLEVYEAGTEAERSELELNIDGQFTSLDAQAKGLAVRNLPDSSGLVQRALDEGWDPQNLKTTLQDLSGKAKQLGSGFTNLESFLMANDLETTESDIKFSNNRAMMESMLTDAISTAGVKEQGFLATGWDMVDRFILRGVITDAEDITNRTARQGSLLKDIALMEPEDARLAMEEYIKGVASEGVLTGDNKFAYEQALKEFYSLGYNASHREEATMAAAFLIPGAIEGASLAGKAAKGFVNSGWGTVTTTALVAGSRKAAAHAQKLITRRGAPEAIIQAGTDLLNIESVARKSVNKNHRLYNTTASISPVLPPTPVVGNRAMRRAGVTPKQPAQYPIQPFSGVTVAPTPSAVLPAPAVPAAPAVASRTLAGNRLLQVVSDRIRNFSGKPLSETDEAAKIAATKAHWENTTAHPVVNISREADEFHDEVLTFQLGTKEGLPFDSEEAARAMQKAIADGETKARADVAMVRDGEWVVQIQDRMTFSGGSSTLNTVKVGPLRALLMRWLGSTSLLDHNLNYAAASRGEAVSSSLGKALAPYLKSVKRLKEEEKEVLAQVFQDLNYGADSHLRDYYDDVAFAAKYASLSGGTMPSQKVIEAYHALQTIDDTRWFLQASDIMRSLVEDGYMKVSTHGGAPQIGRKVARASVPEKALIREASGMMQDKSKFVPNTVFYELMDDVGGVRFVADPESVSVLHYADVLGRNAGGVRAYKDNFFLVIGDGTEAVAKLTARTEKQAVKAQKGLNTILDAIRMNAKDIDDVIRANNSFDPQIDSLTKMQDWLAKNNVKASDNFEYKANHGRASSSQGVVASGKGSLTYGQMFLIRQARSDKALPSVGMSSPHIEDPLGEIGVHFSSATHALANQAAIYEAANSWVNTLKGSKEATGWEIPTEYQNADAVTQYLNAREVGGAMQPTATQQVLRDVRRIIEQRHNLTQQMGTDAKIDSFLAKIGEAILDSKAGSLPPVKYFAGKMIDKGANPDALLKAGMFSAFGFFNVRQLFVQSFHGLVFAPMIAGNTQAAKAVISGIPTKFAMYYEGTPTGALLNKRLAAFFETDTETVDKFIRYMNNNGRSVVGHESLELGTRSAQGLGVFNGRSLGGLKTVREGVARAQRGVSAAADASMAFYRVGEATTRHSTTAIAFWEYVKKNPGKDPLSKEALDWMMLRDQTLGLHMTNVGRAQLQTGLGRFPSQWLSYSLRSMETILLGRDASSATGRMTKGERIRAAAALSVMWGANGMGLGLAADELSEFLGFEPEEGLSILIKDGILDALLHEVDLDVSVNSSLAPLGNVIETFRALQEDSVVETLGGPSAQIVGGGAAAFISMVGNTIKGNPALSKEDLIRFIRTPSGIDNYWKAYGIYQHQALRSKSGYKYDVEFEEMDAIMQLAGLPTRGVAMTNQARTQLYRDSQRLQNFQKEITRDRDRAYELIDRGDIEGGRSLLHELDVKIELSPFGFSEQRSLRTSLYSGEGGSKTWELFSKLMKQDNEYRASSLMKATGQD